MRLSLSTWMWTLGLACACSVLNDPGELLPNEGGSTGGTDGSGATDGTGGAEGGAGPSGGDGGGSGGGDGGPGPVGSSQGLIVVGGINDAARGVLSVLDPETGEELNRETLASGVRVAAIAYDGAADRDLWFVFTAGAFPASDAVPANLQVRRFDPVDGEWTVVDTVTNLPPPLPESLVVLNQRLAYISYVVRDGDVEQSITLLDTANPAEVTQISFTAPTLDENEALVGLVGVRGIEEDATAVGGTLNLLVSSSAIIKSGWPVCEGRCDVQIQPIAVGSNIQTGLRTTVGQNTATPASVVYGLPRAAVDRRRRDTLVVTPGSPPLDTVNLYRVEDPRNPAVATLSILPLMAEHLGGFSVAECEEVLLATLPEGTLEGISRIGVRQSANLNDVGQLVFYEPLTKTVIAPFNPISGEEQSELAAFSLEVNSSGSSLSLSRRTTDWAPPTDLKVDALAVGAPYPLSCP